MHSEWCSIPEATAAAVDSARAPRREGGCHRHHRGEDAGVLCRGAGTVGTGQNVKRTSSSHPVSSSGWSTRLVTNFHVPGSTLVVLVAAFMGDRWREAYQTALERGYRFLSFGDAMLAER